MPSTWPLLALVALVVTACGGRHELPAGAAAVGHHPPAARALDAVVRDAPLRVAPVSVGPLADYEPIGAVLTHQLGREFGGPLTEALDEVLGAHHVTETFDETTVDPEGDETLLWIRDYQPIFVRRRDGTLKAVRYLSANATRSRYLPAAQTTDEDAAPAPGWAWFPVDGEGRGRWLEVEDLPLVHENGNLVRAGRWVFATEQLLTENATTWDEPHLQEAGFVPRSADEVLRLMGAALERDPADIVILPTMPGEPTGHVDMFLMALGPDTVVVPSVDEESITIHRRRARRDLGREVAGFLDDVAAAVELLGLTVVRLPMMAPFVWTGPNAASDPDLLYMSPTNGLLVRADGRRVVLVPTLPDVMLGLVRGELQGRYESLWRGAFDRLGWEPRPVDAGQLALGYGLLRCASAPLPP